jgi:hypothetical protein
MENNPWNSIKLSDYVSHMSNKNVLQTQMLNTIIKEQLVTVNNIQKSSVAILGITDGNGLEHINPLKVCEVIGIDINNEYLCQCKEKHEHLSSILNLQCIDLMTEKNKAVKFLENPDLIIADLIIEHIHLDNFIEIISRLSLKNRTVSCVIQYNPDGSLISSSGYEHTQDCLLSIIEEQSEEEITDRLFDIGYKLIFKKIYNLPNDKLFIRLDYNLK